MSNDDFFSQRPAEQPPAGPVYPPQGYGTPGYGAPVPQPGYPGYPAYGYPYAQQKTNGLAIAALVVALVSLVSCPPVGAVGAVLGHVARKQIRERGEEGAGMALAGVVVGWLATALGIVAIALLFLLPFLAAAGSGMTV